MKRINSESGLDLVSTLRTLDISVPGRIDGRTTAHTEIWIAARLLATLENASALNYPLEVTHRDRPDFLLNAGSASIGIEATEAISQSYAACCALRDREYPDADIDLGLFRWGANPLTVDQMRDLLVRGEMQSDGWAGDSAERQWAQYITDIINAKLRKLSSPTFDKFEQNWLAIYDNLPLPHLHLEKAIVALRPLTQQVWTAAPSFHAIYVERGPVIARIMANDSVNLVLNDIWP